MITRNDCLLLLADMSDNGIDTEDATRKLVMSNDVPIEVIKFINDHRQLDLSAFYEKLRKSYNNKKSNLYINLVKEDLDEPSKLLSTLASLQLQILLFSDKAEDREMFLRHSRAREVALVLSNYFKTYDLTNCVKLLRLVKADLKALESIKPSTKKAQNVKNTN